MTGENSAYGRLPKQELSLLLQNIGTAKVSAEVAPEQCPKASVAVVLRTLFIISGAQANKLGASCTSGWGKKDDDDEEWAHKCARQAVKMCKPQMVKLTEKRSGGRKR